jgi:hypothetical protein
MNKAISLPRAAFGSRGKQLITAMKAVALVAVVWGGVFPALVWSLEQLLPQG